MSDSPPPESPPTGAPDPDGSGAPFHGTGQGNGQGNGHGTGPSTGPDIRPAPEPSAEPLLSVRDVRLEAGHRTLVSLLSFDLAAGDRLVLVGGNGAGKSTLLSALAGLTEPAAGSIRRPRDPPGVLFQDGGLWPHMTVTEHLEFVDTHNDVPWRKRLLETFDLSSLADHKPEALSGGERLRLSLARSLANRPRWVLLDEPLAHLDPLVVAGVRESLPRLLDELGAASIVVTHDPDDVLHFGDRLISLSGHRGWWAGPARFALDSPPTRDLAAFAGNGTILSTVADHDGHADFGFGLDLTGCSPGEIVEAYLDAAAVRVVDETPHALRGRYVAPDRRGGCYVRVDEKLLHCGESAGPHSAGAQVCVRLEGRVRRLLDDTTFRPPGPQA